LAAGGIAQKPPSELWRFGELVERAGDIDGDGIEDWLIADEAPNRAWLVSGRDGSVLRNLDLGIAAPAFVQCVAGLGDVDGDGVPDVGMAVVLPNVETGTCPIDEPSVTGVFSGRDGSLIRLFSARSLTGLGDVDGDGCADVLVVERETVGPYRTMDRASLCSGRTGEVLWSVQHTCPYLTDAPSARSFTGLDGSTGPDAILVAGDRVFVLRRGDGSIALSIGEWKEMPPASAAAVGDVDGDGCGDLVVGYVDDCVTSASEGCVRVYSGRTGSLVWSRSGEGGYPGAFGDDVDGAGDLDGDGTPDVLVTTWTTLTAPNGILVLSGRSGRVIREFLPDLSDCHRRFCARSIPDVDGDGVNDVLAGITPADYPCADGLVEAFSGKTRRVLWRFRRNGSQLESTPTPGDERWTR
jgi:hypothetical protein